MVNYHHEFPLPATYLIEINGSVGSIQLFVNSSESFDKFEISNLTPSHKLALQKLLIFDLLFFNRDRHKKNILVQSTSNKIFGIDHGDCLVDSLGPLRIEYLDCLADRFNPEISKLISVEALSEYQKILKGLGVEIKFNNWMSKASSEILKCIDKNFSPKLTAKEIMSQFEENEVF